MPPVKSMIVVSWSWLLLAVCVPGLAVVGCGSSGSDGSGEGGQTGGGTGGKGTGGSSIGTGGSASGSGGAGGTASGTGGAAAGTGGAGGAVSGTGGARAGTGGAVAGTGGAASGTGGAGTGGQGGPATLTLTSTVLTNAAAFLPAYTCAGDNHSPPLAWTAGPTGTLSYAIVLVDTSIGRYHWAIWNIPPTVRALPEMLPAGASITTPVSAMQAITGTGTPSYQGPCPSGNLHTYVFTAYALNVATLPGVATGVMAQAVFTAIQSHVLASGTLSGTSNATRP